MLGRLFRTLIGKPLATDEAGHQRIGKLTALAVFSSDALSSVAYATQEIFLTVSIAGAAAFALSLPIAAAICILLIVLTASYRQTIFAYPTGGGAYIVAKENLGTFPGLVAGAALLVDYVLTVSVSIASGIQAVTSAYEPLKAHAVLLCLIAVILVTWGNLRGVKESARMFSVPTYFFIAMMVVLVGVGIFKQPAASTEAARQMVHPVIPPGFGAFLLLHGFASGCAALTGVEAISNGVPAFEKPEPKNAAATMIWMAVVLGGLFVGVTLMAHVYGAEYHNLEHFVETVGHGKDSVEAHAAFDAQDSVMAQVAHKVFGGGALFYVMQAATAAILLLAANTSFADFPRLASLLAADGFLPRQLAMRGDRLVFSNGIIILAGLAALLIVVFGGSIDALVPLYAVGVFVSFTLSQTGMVVHWFKDRKGAWYARALMNGVGAIVTAVVLMVIASAKFLDGAWIVVILIPLIVLGFQAIKRHYGQAGAQLRMEGTAMPPRPAHHKVIIPVAGVHRGVLTALSYAMSMSDDVTAVAIDIDPAATERLQEAWGKLGLDVKLVVLPSPFRSLIQPLLEYIDKVDAMRADDVVTVVLPEFVPARWWQHALHNQSALQIKAALMFKRNNVVVTSVRHHLDN
jgi:amino acid transporter